MQDWKITIAEGIVSYSKSGKKNVKIVTKDNKTGAAVAQAMQANMKNLCADFKGMSKYNKNNWSYALIGSLVDPLAAFSTAGLASAVGSGWKTFYIQTGSWQAQEQLMNNIKKVKTEVSEYKNTAADPTPVATDDPKGNDEQKNSYLWIGAAIIAVILIVWALRKK